MTSDELPGMAAAFRRGADEASAALAKWLGRPVTLAVQRLEAVPLTTAAAALGSGAEPVCGCAMGISGAIGGVLLLAAADQDALALADTLIERSPGTSTSWNEIERSALIETANIVGCSYLNVVCNMLVPERAEGILPSPPLFLRDFPAALMEAMLLELPSPAETVLLAKTAFAVDATAVRCGLLFLPDAESLARLRDAADGPRSRP
jgi:chemotaxis protein CheC